MALETYRKKRKFGVTKEPRGRKGRRGGDQFVIQKHAATRLHYDLRLELDGVMKSWAVTRGPSLVPGEKRLAIHVEDHPIEYNTFEGTIPKGEYGGGTVLIWDRGRWIPDHDPRKGYAKGHLDFTLEGKKLHGRWHLVRMRKRPGEKQEPWLLIKSDDEAARSLKDPDILEEKPKSVASGRSMEAIAKADDAVWRSNKSVSENWIKSKGSQSQEFVIVGYNDASHLKSAIGALVLGFYENGELRYAGRSGTGYTMETAHDLWTRLQPLLRDDPPFGKAPPKERGRKAHWVEPKLAAEIDFAGWTGAKRVRHAVFKGLREDKPAREIARETPMPTKKIAKKAAATKLAAKPAKKFSAREKSKATNNSPVKFTHPDRIYWTDVEITKQQLADYYKSVWDHMAPHVVNRPLALVRCPEGAGGQCFFQKHAAAGLTSKRVRRIKDAKGEELIYIDDLDGLLTLVQAGVLEIHAWGSTVGDIERCNRIVFDLDPGDDVPWPAVNAAAKELRGRLDDLKLKSFVKTSGGKGLHVVLPTGGTPWDEAKDFSHAMVLAMAADAPDRYVAKMTKSIRGGKIFLDYLRNGRGATSVVAYSTRARAGAPVSAPVAWEELGPKLAPNMFTMLNIGKRLASLKKDPWADIGRVKQHLPDIAKLKKHG